MRGWLEAGALSDAVDTCASLLAGEVDPSGGPLARDRGRRHVAGGRRSAGPRSSTCMGRSPSPARRPRPCSPATRPSPTSGRESRLAARDVDRVAIADPLLRVVSLERVELDRCACPAQRSAAAAACGSSARRRLRTGLPILSVRLDSLLGHVRPQRLARREAARLNRHPAPGRAVGGRQVHAHGADRDLPRRGERRNRVILCRVGLRPPAAGLREREDAVEGAVRVGAERAQRGGRRA